MKKTFRFFGIIALALLIGFSFITCSNPTGGGGGGGGGGLTVLNCPANSIATVYINAHPTTQVEFIDIYSLSNPVAACTNTTSPFSLIDVSTCSNFAGTGKYFVEVMTTQDERFLSDVNFVSGIASINYNVMTKYTDLPLGY